MMNAQDPSSVIPQYPHLAERARGGLRFLHRKAHVADDWNRGGQPSALWDATSNPPMASFPRFDLLDSSYAVALMADVTPAWRELYADILDQLVARHTTWWAAIDWMTMIGDDPELRPHLEGRQAPHFRVYDFRHTYAACCSRLAHPCSTSASRFWSQEADHDAPVLREMGPETGDRRWVDLLGRELAQPQAEVEPETGPGCRRNKPRQRGPGAAGKETENAGGARGSAPLAPNGEP